MLDVQIKLKKLANKQKAKVLQRFFKTGPGQYGEGDVFLGVAVPELRKLAREYQDSTFKDLKELLRSSIHEERALALLILVDRFLKGDEPAKKKIYELYLKKTKYINNWDLVDLSAAHIVGGFLAGKSRQPLYCLARSGNMWERRIAIIATFHLIRQNEFAETLMVAEMLLSDTEDLIHKAVGWMLREVGKRDHAVEETFLKKHYRDMPRTMLRYAIERFPETTRQQYLRKD